MNEPEQLALATLSGSALGMIFFGGLWWTIRRGLASTTPAFWFLGSWWVRTLLAIAGFYVAAQGNWRRLACCLTGFVLARAAVTHATQRSDSPTQPTPTGGSR